MADIAFVIVGLDDTFTDVTRRMSAHFKAGAGRVVVVEPEAEELLVYNRDAAGRINGRWTERALAMSLPHMLACGTIQLAS